MANFDIWVNRRTNNINEGMLDWLLGKSNEKNTPWIPDEPTEVNKTIYGNPIVQKYTNTILKHLNIAPGETVQLLKHDGTPDGGPRIIKDWNVEFPEFIRALQRFIAGHILGKGKEKSFLRISHHDAFVILKTLDRISTSPSGTSVADRLHIDNPISLSNWIQTKVPVAPDAILQKGFGQGNTEYMARRVARTGRGNPMVIPNVKNLVDAGEEVVSQYLTKTSPSNRIGIPLANAINKLQSLLTPFLSGRAIDPAHTPKKKATVDDDDAEVDTH